MKFKREPKWRLKENRSEEVSRILSIAMHSLLLFSFVSFSLDSRLFVFSFFFLLIIPLENMITLGFLPLISRSQTSRYILSISNAQIGPESVLFLFFSGKEWDSLAATCGAQIQSRKGYLILRTKLSMHMEIFSHFSTHPSQPGCPLRFHFNC